jgi:SAM-dependent methyltransferase
MSTLKKILQKELFNPGPLGLLINPFFIARRALYGHIRQLAPQLGGNLVDVGCGSKPYRKLINCSQYTGLDTSVSGHDHRNEDIDVLYDGKTFPFPNKTFDAVLCNQVLEHVFHPQLFLSEINRVCKTGAKCLFTVPFVWDEHEQPFDYARYSSFGLKALFEQHGFRVVEQRKSVKNFGVVFQLINGYLYKKTVRFRPLRILATLLLMFPFNLLGLFFGFILPNNEDLYLDNIVLIEKEKDLPII